MSNNQLTDNLLNTYGSYMHLRVFVQDQFESNILKNLYLIAVDKRNKKMLESPEFIDAGFDGHVTLELANLANLPITLYPGMKIGQISFITMTSPAEKPYGSGAQGSKYQGQRGPTPSRYFENFK